jgi:glucan-binding YG repeat protein
MRDLLRGIAIGVIIATGVLALVHFTNPPQVVTKEKEKPYTVDAAVAFLEKHDYEVVKKDAVKPNASKEAESEKVEEKVEENDQTNKETESTKEKTPKEHQLVIKSGMNSFDVAEVLFQNGIVDDAEDFNDFLEKNDYQRIIRPGTYTVHDQMSYEQLAIIITK